MGVVPEALKEAEKLRLCAGAVRDPGNHVLSEQGTRVPDTPVPG